ncbi:MAG TPA: phenylalanine--tRNA ligase subunit beta [Actinopolymorphaceae bacterium]|jgi:phenylalanyl-tRNA synthetase beta chain
MRVSLSWLRQHADVPASDDVLAVAATLVGVGLEEEGWELADVVGPLVVGRVLSAEPEPQTNGKTIIWCQVQVGPDGSDGSVRGIVCGAHNFGSGDLVVVALPGAVLPGGFAIAARETYGHVSDGMICSQKELGLGDDHTGIIVLDRLGLHGEPGDDAITLLGLDDEVLDVNVTPDRGYCFSVRGIAREYALASGSAFRDPAAVDVAAATGTGWPVRLEDVAPVRDVVGCDRYVARIVRGIDTSRPAPYWLRHRLQQAGMRPISLAVDVTNYVMLSTGQPLHAFDAAALAGPIVVRRAKAGEKLTTLDGVTRSLFIEDLLITDEDADSASRVLAIAGLMGGADTEVTTTTTDILIEAAHFAAVSVGRSARRHKLVTEAGRRFERGVDPLLPTAAAQLAVDLLVRYGGGVPDPDWTDERLGGADAAVIELETARVGALVGVDYTRAQVVDVLVGIGCSIAELGAGTIAVAVPSWRPDLTRPVDLIEEVARVNGYASIPSVLPSAPAGSGLTRSQRARSSVGRALAEQGYVEVLSSPFIGADVFDAWGLPADDPRRIALSLTNPMSDEQPLLRTSLLESLLPVLVRNVGRNSRHVGLFEIGSVTRPRKSGPVEAPVFQIGRRATDEQIDELIAALPLQPLRLAVALSGDRVPSGWWGGGRPGDWTDAVEAVREVADRLHVALVVTADSDHLPWHPGRCARLTLADGTLVGHAGELHPRVVTNSGLPARSCAAEIDLDVLVSVAKPVVPAVPISTYPAAFQDVALVVASSTPSADVTAALTTGAGPLLESLDLFDVYSGDQLPAGTKSLAYRLTFRAPDRTLTAEEASSARSAAVATAAERVGAVQRG